MSPTELLELIHREPFFPFTVYLANGTTFHIERFEDVEVSGMNLLIFDSEPDGESIIRFVSIPNLIQVSFVIPGGEIPNDR